LSEVADRTPEVDEARKLEGRAHMESVPGVAASWWSRRDVVWRHPRI
jgi:hypothetical protein